MEPTVPPPTVRYKSFNEFRDLHDTMCRTLERHVRSVVLIEREEPMPIVHFLMPCYNALLALTKQTSCVWCMTIAIHVSHSLETVPMYTPFYQRESLSGMDIYVRASAIIGLSMRVSMCFLGYSVDQCVHTSEMKRLVKQNFAIFCKGDKQVYHFIPKEEYEKMQAVAMMGLPLPADMMQIVFRNTEAPEEDDVWDNIAEE